MNKEDLVFAGVVVILFILIIVVIGAFILVSGMVSNFMGLTGVNWWACAIVTFLLLVGVVLMINRIGRTELP